MQSLGALETLRCNKVASAMADQSNLSDEMLARIGELSINPNAGIHCGAVAALIDLALDGHVETVSDFERLMVLVDLKFPVQSLPDGAFTGGGLFAKADWVSSVYKSPTTRPVWNSTLAEAIPLLPVTILEDGMLKMNPDSTPGVE